MATARHPDLPRRGRGRRSRRSTPTWGWIRSIRTSCSISSAEAHLSLGEFEHAVAALKQRLDRNPNSAVSYALLAVCHGHLGRIAESRAAWTSALKIEPDFSMERRRRVCRSKNPQDFELRVEGLRKAGVHVRCKASVWVGFSSIRVIRRKTPDAKRPPEGGRSTRSPPCGWLG